jgi:hypothetical protein
MEFSHVDRIPRVGPMWRQLSWTYSIGDFIDAASRGYPCGGRAALRRPAARAIGTPPG